MNTSELVRSMIEPEPGLELPTGWSVAELCGELCETVRRGQPIIQTLPCGWALLDETVGGLVRGEYVGLIGIPGVGKSTLADSLIVGILHKNPDARALIFAIETAPMIRLARLVAAASVEDNGGSIGGVSVSGILRGNLRDSGQGRAIEAANQLSSILGERMRFYGDCTAASEIAQIIRTEQPDIVLVDHLGLVTSETRGDSEISRFDGALGCIATALRMTNCAGVLINETGKQALRADSIDMSASRGSARFASLAGMFIGLKRIPPEPPGHDPTVTALLCKSRFGPTGKQQSAVFFGGLSYFSWGGVEDLPDAQEKAKDDDEF